MDKSLVKRLQGFFFEAALATYAGGTVKKETIPDFPGSKVYRYERSDLLYIDTYFVNGQSSGGQTLIYHNHLPVWIMQYHGWCKYDDPQVLTFLKKVLTKTYKEGEFCGGRGKYSIEHWTSDDGLFVYENHPTLPPPTDEFINFMGHESIMTRAWKPDQSHVVFWHRYQGYLLEK